jgi:endonuclease/exonuclease/phosphatase family metal-dependent hydrolase
MLLGLLLALLAPDSHAGERLLRTMSYNIHGMVLVKNDHSRYAKIGRALEARRRAGTAPEIVAVQEAFHKRTPELWREAKYPFVVKGPAARGLRISSGLVILSEYPIVRAENLVYKDCMDVDCMARKGAQRVAINVPGIPFPVDFINTHLQATYGSRVFPPPSWMRAARMRQVKTLIQFVGRHLSPGAMLLLGDFNFREDTADYDKFTDELELGDGALMCAARPDVCDGADEMSETSKSSVDHAFVSQEGQGSRWSAEPVYYRRTFRELVGGQPLSDHLAVESTWRMRW